MDSELFFHFRDFFNTVSSLTVCASLKLWKPSLRPPGLKLNWWGWDEEECFFVEEVGCERGGGYCSLHRSRMVQVQNVVKLVHSFIPGVEGKVVLEAALPLGVAERLLVDSAGAGLDRDHRGVHFCISASALLRGVAKCISGICLITVEIQS
jgi:hypothetical protein